MLRRGFIISWVWPTPTSTASVRASTTRKKSARWYWWIATRSGGNSQMPCWRTSAGGASWDGNGLAYPHRAGFRPVSDRCQTSVRPVSSTVSAQSMSQSCLLPHAQSMSPCRMSDLRSHVGSADAQCHFGGTVLTEIHQQSQSNLKVVRCW